MDISIILWIGGMLFSLSIFAVKVGFGLSFSKMGWKGILTTLSMYLVLFVLIAMLSEQLMKLLEPVLKKGYYLHALMASGMIAWGIYLLRGQKAQDRIQTNSKSKIQTSKSKNSTGVNHHSLLLLIPCPVCLTAIIFSTWAALNVIKFPAALVGLGLGIVFFGLSLFFYFLLKVLTLNSSLITQEIGLGLGMIAIGLYLISSLFLPRKIEEARIMYQSFITESNGIALNDYIGILIIIFVAMLIGFFINKNKQSASR